MPKKRTNKTKKEIVSDIQLVQDADRRRALIKDVVFPFLVSMDKDIQYSKLFLQSTAGMIETVYEERRKKTAIGEMSVLLNEKLDSLFSDKNEEKERYRSLIEKLSEVSVQDFAYAAELGRYIDGYMLKNKGKEPMSNIPIDEILG
jgi:hypothetical protein